MLTKKKQAKSGSLP